MFSLKLKTVLDIRIVRDEMLILRNASSDQLTVGKEMDVVKSGRNVHAYCLFKSLPYTLAYGDRQTDRQTGCLKF
jgi:hypothetical protein